MRINNSEMMMDENQLMLMESQQDDNTPKAGSIEALDPFNRMPPGHSLTGPKGKWAWENPPRFSDPEEAIDFVIEKIEDPSVERDMLKLMAAGISIEEIVETVAIGGFSTGHYNPDVAELIKAPIALYLAGLAVENNIPPKLFNSPTGNPREADNVTDEQALSIMQDRNPEVLQALKQSVDEQDQQQIEQAQMEDNSFLSPKLDQEKTVEEKPDGIS